MMSRVLRSFALLILSLSCAIRAAWADIPPYPPPTPTPSPTPHMLLGGDRLTLMAGLLMSAAAILGGLYLQRRRNALPAPSGRLVAAVAGLLVIAAGAVLIVPR